MTLQEARVIWPDKILWINFPSAVHLEPISVIEETTRQLLRQAAPGDRFLVGITEDVPGDRCLRQLRRYLTCPAGGGGLGQSVPHSAIEKRHVWKRALQETSHVICCRSAFYSRHFNNVIEAPTERG